MRTFGSLAYYSLRENGGRDAAMVAEDRQRHAASPLEGLELLEPGSGDRRDCLIASIVRDLVGGEVV